MADGGRAREAGDAAWRPTSPPADPETARRLVTKGNDLMPVGARPAPGSASPRAIAARGEPPRVTTIGVLVDWLPGEYQSAVVGGIVEAARASDINLVIFTGGPLRSSARTAERRNLVYDLAGSEEIDALVVLIGDLGNYLGFDELARYCERFKPRPMCCIAAELPGMTAVLVEGEDALREGIRHLVEDHGYQRIGFVGGPPGNTEARARRRVFGEVLTDHGMAPPDSSIASGDFLYESGVDAVRLLLDERAGEFDALVVANDLMALGVIDALRARGLRVPRDMAILGFDDIAEARYSAPPLTTIRQPLAEQGRLAVDVLLRRLGGEPVDERLVLDAELIVRGTCGCYSDARRATLSSAAPSLTDDEAVLDVGSALQLRRSRITAALRKPVAGLVGAIPAGWDEELLDLLIAELQGSPSGPFAERVDELLEQSSAVDGTGSWQPALFGLRRELLPCLVADPAMRSRAEDVLRGAQLLAAEAMEHIQARRRLTIERRARVLSEASDKISAALDLPSLSTALNASLPRLDVAGGYLVLYDYERASASASVPALTAGGAASPEAARRRLVFDHGNDTAVPKRLGEPTFGVQNLLPDGLLPTDRRYAVVIEPLFFEEDPLGYAIFELGPLEGLIYEALRERIRGVLKVALLIEELELRAAELQAAYQALQDQQGRLLSAEKMASLGRITASIAHEMNTPLAAVRTALMEIDKRAAEYQASIGDDDVTAADHAEIAQEMRASLQLASSAAARAAAFVRGIKTQTRDLSAQHKIAFDPTLVIEEALLLLGYDLRRASCELDFRPPERPLQLMGTPGFLAQVVMNLVSNALDAMAGRGGRITLTLSEAAGTARLIVEDTAGGIPVELLDKVFEPMFTTKPFGQGTGLGLSIVHDLVTGQFGGTVAVESRPGVGTTFTLSLPLAGGS
jgi:sigma-B regulation protein RsbU (phosphoserine phosphatase)